MKATLQLFVDKEKAVGVDLKNEIETECRIIVNRLFPRSRTGEQTLQLRFAAETGIPLSFENEIVF